MTGAPSWHDLWADGATARATRATRATAHAARLAARGTDADIHRRHPGRTESHWPADCRAQRSAVRSFHVGFTPPAVRESQMVAGARAGAGGRSI